MNLGARLRLALKIVFGRNVELVHCEDGHAAVKAEETLRAMFAERTRLHTLGCFPRIDYWMVEPNWSVHVPRWFEGSVKAGSLAVVHQTIRQTVAVIRWD